MPGWFPTRWGGGGVKGYPLGEKNHPVGGVRVHVLFRKVFEIFDFLGGAMLVEVFEASNQKLLAHEIATPPTHKNSKVHLF